MKICEIIRESFDTEFVEELYYGVSEYIKNKSTNIKMFKYYTASLKDTIWGRDVPPKWLPPLQKLYVTLLDYGRKVLDLDIAGTENEMELVLKHGILPY